MKCPNCGMDMKKFFCFHCGYMTNGIIINTKKPIEYTLLEIYFDKKYDKIIRNENWFISGILGPVYILSHNYFLIGALLIVLDTMVSIFFCVLNHALLMPLVIVLANYCYAFFNRLLWATIGNSIYLKLLSKKLIKLKEKYPSNYKEQIQKLYKKDMFLLPFKYLVFGFICYCIFIILRGTIYQYILF